MFGKFWTWCKSFFKREPLGMYAPKDRLLFRYWNGKRWVQADPLILYKRWMDVCVVLRTDLNLSTMESKEASNGHKRAITTIREMFNLDPLVNDIEAEGTLTDTECIDLFVQFCEYTSDVKKKANNSSIPATETSASVPSSSDASSPILSSSVSGSIVSEPSTVPPAPSLSVSELPLASSLPEKST